jgi:hypothetical protein
MWPIGRIEDILLDPDAKVAGSYKLTTLALYQLCNTLCPGLYGLARELSGINRTVEQARSDYSFDDSLDFINRLIRRRFKTRLAGKILLRNTNTGVIDGVLNAQYRWLSNLSLYDMVAQAMEQLSPKPTFWEANLSGRWLLLRFCVKKPYFEMDIVDHKERFYLGYSYSNDELGRAAVRGGPFILRKDGHTASLAPVSLQDRVRHQGSNFNNRLQFLLNECPRKIEKSEVYLSNMLRLTQNYLALSSALPGARDKERDKLARKLTREQFPLTIAKKVVASLCAQASAVSTAAGPAIHRNSARTSFDLYNALGREAKTLPIRYRECAEQLAYSVLINKISL